MTQYCNHDIASLIHLANDVHANEGTVNVDIAVELHKVEGYLRKSFIILRELEKYHQGNTLEDDTCRNILNALARDAGYLRARSRLTAYSLEDVSTSLELSTEE